MLWRDAIWTWNFAWKIWKRSLVRPRYKWEDNIKMDLKYVLLPSHWQQGQALCSCGHSNGPYCSVVTHSAIQCNIITKGVRKVTPPVCIEVKRKTKYSSECVLWLCSSLFRVAPSRLTQRRQHWTTLRAYRCSTAQAVRYTTSSHVTRIRRAANNRKSDGAKSGL